MRTLVTYLSRSGNTRRIAEAIYSAIEGQKDIRSIREVKDVDGYDLVFVGFPVIGEGMPAQVRRFIRKNLCGKRIALFLTHGMPSEMDEFSKVVPNCQSDVSDAQLSGIFDCQGEMVRWMPRLLRIHPYGYVRRWAKMGPDSHGAGKPDEGDIERAKCFARSILKSL